MYKKGTIVLVPFPFTNLKSIKIRPAVIISDGHYGDDIVMLFISSKKQMKRRRFDVNVIATATNGLKITSTVKCSKIATLDKKIVLGKLGVISQKDLKKIEQKCKTFLGLK